MSDSPQKQVEDFKRRHAAAAERSRHRRLKWGLTTLAVIAVIGIGAVLGGDDEADSPQLRAEHSAVATVEAPPPSEADRLLGRLANRCEEDEAQLRRMADYTVQTLREDGGIESTRLEQLRGAIRATAGPHPRACSGVFATMLVLQIGS